PLRCQCLVVARLPLTLLISTGLNAGTRELVAAGTNAVLAEVLVAEPLYVMVVHRHGPGSCAWWIGCELACFLRERQTARNLIDIWRKVVGDPDPDQVSSARSAGPDPDHPELSLGPF